MPRYNGTTPSGPLQGWTPPPPGLQMHPFYSPFLMVTGNQGFYLTACIRVFIWTPSGCVHGIQLRSPTVNSLI